MPTLAQPEDGSDHAGRPRQSGDSCHRPFTNAEPRGARRQICIQIHSAVIKCQAHPSREINRRLEPFHRYQRFVKKRRYQLIRIQPRQRLGERPESDSSVRKAEQIQAASSSEEPQAEHRLTAKSSRRTRHENTRDLPYKHQLKSVYFRMSTNQDKPGSSNPYSLDASLLSEASLLLMY